MIPDHLTTEHFVIKRFHRKDADALYEAVAASLPELALWLPWAHPHYGRDDSANYLRDSLQSWKDGRAHDFAIRRHDQPDRHLGNISIWTVSRMGRVAELGYWVRTDETSTGVATEVAARLIEVGFDDLLMNKITLRVAVGNRASERVAEKLGFMAEGILREELLIRGHWVDHTLYSLLEREWRARI